MPFLWSRGPEFDSHWELSSSSSLSYLSIRGASLIRSLVEVQHYWFFNVPIKMKAQLCSFSQSKLNRHWKSKNAVNLFQFAGFYIIKNLYLIWGTISCSQAKKNQRLSSRKKNSRENNFDDAENRRKFSIYQRRRKKVKHTLANIGRFKAKITSSLFSKKRPSLLIERCMSL